MMWNTSCISRKICPGTCPKIWKHAGDRTISPWNTRIITHLVIIRVLHRIFMHAGNQKYHQTHRHQLNFWNTHGISRLPTIIVKHSSLPLSIVAPFSIRLRASLSSLYHLFQSNTHSVFRTPFQQNTEGKVTPAYPPHLKEYSRK